MSLAEVFLRVGCALVGWIVAFGHLVLVAVIPAVDCAAPGDPWLVTSATAVPAVFAIGLLRTSDFLASGLRWLGLPLLLLAAVALRAVLPDLATTLGGTDPCGFVAAGELPLWRRAWAPVQLLVLGGLLWSALRLWLIDSSKRAQP